MKILITGASGLIGIHMLAEFIPFHEVIGVDKEEGDLRDIKVIRHHLEEYHPDYVLHLAAKVGRLFGEEDLMETVKSNAGITANVAKACGERGVRIAYASSSEVYGDFGEKWVEEESLNCEILPKNLYGLTKRWGEEVCKLYAPDGLIILRFGMPIGDGYKPGFGRAAIATFIWNAMHHKPIIVHRDTERSWCWVGDVASATRLIIQSAWKDEKWCGTWNVGRDDNQYTMEEVAIKICNMVGANPNLIELANPPGDITRKKRHSTERLRSLGWAPRVSFDEMLIKTYEWLQQRRG